MGEKEKTNKTVNIRTRDNKQHGELSMEDTIHKFETLAKERIIKSEEYGWSTEPPQQPE